MSSARPASEPVQEDFPAVLVGVWRFERRIDDHRSGERGRAGGEARFVCQGDGLVWSESGDLQFGDFAGPVSRSLLIVPAEAGWQVRFEDGRYFHDIDLDQGECRAEHPCRQDHYSGSLKLVETAGGPELTTDWRVLGPDKDHLIHTRYQKYG